MRYRVFKKAHQQLIGVWLYTEREWGAKQADKYLDGLYAAFKKTCQNSSSWKRVRGKAFVGVFFVRYQRHIIFFKLLAADDIGIISVLHENMNLPNSLLSDLNQGE